MTDPTPIDLAMARVEREEDNRRVSVDELLRLALKDVKASDDRGAEPVRSMVLIVRQKPNGSESLDTYRCNMSRLEEIAYLELWRSRTVACIND
ncbi:MAG: hypothetical protein ACM31O_03765 [Bacteroidota bacterium]